MARYEDSTGTRSQSQILKSRTIPRQKKEMGKYLKLFSMESLIYSERKTEGEYT